MRFYNLAFIHFIVFVFSSKGGIAQTNNLAAQEKRFVNLYTRLFKFTPSESDSIAFYSEKFSKEFKTFIKANPSSLAYPFKKFSDSNYIQIATSDDKNFRIYTWDTWEGGSMHYFDVIYQWRADGKIVTKTPTLSNDDPGSFCSKIFTVDIEQKRYYLSVTNHIYSTEDASQSIAVYNIDGDKLYDTTKLFHTKTKSLNHIDVSFDFMSVVDRPERPLELITYDEKQKILYVPVVNSKGQVTSRNIFYQLKDGGFEFAGIETGKRK